MSTPEGISALQAGLRAHQANRLPEAESRYRQALRRDTGNVDALYLLGVLLHQVGRSPEALDSLQRAVAKAPTRAEFLNALGDTLRVLGRYAEARGMLERALAARADYADAQQNLALTLQAEGRTSEALVLLFTAVAAQPASDALRHLLATMLQGVGLQSGNEVVRQVLRLLINDPQVNAQAIAGAVLGLVVAEIDVPALIDGAHREVPNEAFVQANAAVLSHDVLRCALPRLIVTDVRLERALTAVRRDLLRAWRTGTVTNAVWPFVGALAAQCFNTEYAWLVSEAERQMLADLRNTTEGALLAPNLDVAVVEPLLFLSALYAPLHVLAGSRRIAEVPLHVWNDSLRALVQVQLLDYADEQRIERSLEVLSPIDDDVSTAVRAMYEDNPYPRWVTVPQTRAVPLDAFIRSIRTGSPTASSANRRVLVAGCGSGQQPVQLALTHPDAEILAVDLSRASLAYGARMAARLGITRVRFAQADLLELAPADAPFVMISCSGVLHHLRDPLDGWRRLLRWLAPEGVMKIGLYSSRARRSVEAARAVVSNAAHTSDAEGLRAARRTILALPDADVARGILAFADFYSLSGFRDLAMHVQERSYTIPELADALAALGLRFLGFQLPQPVQSAFQAEQGIDARLDLAAWDRFEQAHPATFVAMYQFWCAPHG